MLNILYFILTVTAVGLAVWYGIFYQPADPGADYHMTYSGVSIAAAVIFSGLFASGFLNRRKENPKMLLEKRTGTNS